MIVKVNCIYNNSGAWCKNKNIYRSLFGIGARVCPVHNGGVCSLQIKKKKRAVAPAPAKILDI